MKDDALVLSVLLTASLLFNFFQVILAQNRTNTKLRLVERLLEVTRENEKLRRILDSYYLDADLELGEESE